MTTTTTFASAWDNYLAAVAEALGRPLTMDEIREARHFRAASVPPKGMADTLNRRAGVEG